MTILAEGWAALAGDLRRLPLTEAETKRSLRQAYKNGAAMILARLMVRGPAAITPLFDDVAAMQFLRPSGEHVRAVAHPEWTEHHLDCLFVGGLAMRLGDLGDIAEFQKQVDSFQVQRPM